MSCLPWVSLLRYYRALSEAADLSALTLLDPRQIQSNFSSLLPKPSVWELDSRKHPKERAITPSRLDSTADAAKSLRPSQNSPPNLA